ncbi:unnamed protein product [[Candida] boidinii]|nr:unnamed protein product [[Candida] boidinii]
MQIEINKTSKLKNELEGYRNLKSGSVIEKEDMGLKCYYSGWLTVTKEFYQFPQIDPNSFQQNNTVNSEFTNTTAHGESNNQHHKSSSSSSSFSFSKMMKTASVAVTGGGSNSNTSSDNNQTHSNSNNQDNANGEEAYEDELSSQNNNLDAKKLKAIRRKNRYYAVLKHGNLFLYSDETKSNVQHAIVLANHFVTIWPRSLRDGQLFTRRSAICIMKKTDVDTSEPPPSASTTGAAATGAAAETTIPTLDQSNVDELGIPQRSSSTNTLKKKKSTISLNPSIKDNKIPPAPKDSFFLYGDVNHEKEDWYFALLRASSNLDSYKKSSSPTNNKEKLEPSIYARPLHYYTADMIDLIQTINATEGQLTTKWLNALIGRLFLSVYQTDDFEAYIRANIENKIQKIKTPGFLDDIVIRKLDVGHSAPSLTFPKLKNLSPEGELQVESNFLYQGGLTVEVSTKLFVNLGSRFRTREFSVNLKVKVKKLQGVTILRIKPPPSNRIWWSFAKMPQIELDIEPVISARALSYNLINNIITNRFKEAIRASIVMPFMDDIVFQRTTDETFRGGIWDTKSRPKASPQVNTATVATNNGNNELDSVASSKTESTTNITTTASVSNSAAAVAAALLATNNSPAPSISVSSPTKTTSSSATAPTNKTHRVKQPSIASFDTVASSNTDSQQSTTARKVPAIPPQLPDRPSTDTVPSINSPYAESITSTDVNSTINDENLNEEITPIIDEEQNSNTNSINHSTHSLDFESPSLSSNQLTNLENDSKATINSTESKRIRKLKTQASLLTKRASSIIESKANAFLETTTSNSSSSALPLKDETKDDPFKETNTTLNKYAETVSSSMYKLKGWYSKEKKSSKPSEDNELSSTASSDSKKKKPEMITNRRQNRKSSNNSIGNDSSFHQSLAAPIPEDLNFEQNSMKLSDSVNSNSFTNTYETSPIEFSNASSRGSASVPSQQPPLQNMMLAPNYNADDYNTTTSNSANMFINKDNQKSFRSPSFGSPRTPNSFYNGLEDHDQPINLVDKESIIAEQAQLKSDIIEPIVRKPELPNHPAYSTHHS